MSMFLEIVRDRPSGFWPLGDSSPYEDYSGYSRAASGTPVGQHPALISGVPYSPEFQNANRAQFDFSAFTAGRERSNFTLEAVVRPIAPSTYDPEEPPEQLILGHLGAYDGLVIQGTVISFVTKYNEYGECRAAYDLKDFRSVHIVGVHTEGKNSLFINGMLAAEEDIQDEQIDSGYSATGTTLYSGESTGDGRVAMAAVATYNHAIATESIIRHYKILKFGTGTDSVSASFGGEVINLKRTSEEVFQKQLIDTDYEWNSGLLFNTASNNGVLVPISYGGLSRPGSWTGVFPLDTGDETSISSVVVNWEGEGAVLETSLDGETWVQVQNGSRVPQITNGFNPTGQRLEMRFNFAGFVEDDESSVANFEIIGYRTAVSDASGNKITTVGNTIMGRDLYHKEYADGWGVKFDGTSGLVIDSTDDAPTGERTIEIWAKRNSTANGVLVDTRTSSQSDNLFFGKDGTVNFTWNGTAYVNGQLVTNYYDWPVGEWALIHIVTPNTNLGKINIGQKYTGYIKGQFEVGHLAVYSRNLSADDVQAVYNTFADNNSVVLGESVGVSLAQSPDSTRIYTYDWSIQAAG